MTALSWYREAELHREAYIAILNGAMALPGAKQRFAERVGVSDRYLRYLREQLDTRTPPPALAQKLVEALPLDPEQRRDALLHMHLARHAQRQGTQQRWGSLSTEDVIASLEQLRHAHRVVHMTREPGPAKRQYRALRDEGKALLKHLPAQRCPLVFLEVCLFLPGAQCVLNQPGDALYYAKLAYEFIEGLDPAVYRGAKAQFDYFAMSALMAQAMAYNNLSLPKKAYACHEQAECFSKSDRALYTFWKPHLCRGMIKTLSKQPRFGIRDVERLSYEARTICERRGEGGDWVILLMDLESLASSYMHYENLKKARRTLEHQVEALDNIPLAGPLHKTMVLKTFATVCYKQHDHTGWETYLRASLRLARDAGLTHQIQSMVKHYGVAIHPILEEVEIPLPTAQ